MNNDRISSRELPPWERAPSGGQPPPPPSKPVDFSNQDTLTDAEQATQMQINLENQEEPPPTLEQMMYAVNSFVAVLWPVAFTMIVAGVLVVYVNDGTNGDGAGGSFTIAPPSETKGASTGTQVAGALLNALAIVGVFIVSTFLMVALYYFNCLKVLIGWLVAATTLLLGFTTALVVQIGFTVYQVPMDLISHYFIFYNFAIVGVSAIFYQKGLPRILNQGYLVVVSVVMAWLLLYILPEWTSWALLICLAFYDLCAVLTPCGPLKCLVGLIQTKDDPLPGLLYEADVRDGAIPNVKNKVLPPPPPKEENDGDSDSEDTSSHSSNSPPMSVVPKPTQNNDVTVGVPTRELTIEDNTIKLGLGDFVFYSVLVSRAALYSFPTFVAVFVTILFGLAGTLILLSVFNKALPALPISIFIGVTFYFLTELLVTPFSNFLIIRAAFV